MQVNLAAFYSEYRKMAGHRPLDLVILGAIDSAGGLTLAQVRREPEIFGTLSAFEPAIERLRAAGLVVRTKIDRKVIYTRTPLL